MAEKLSKTYRETAQEFLEKLEEPQIASIKQGAIAFAKYLDSFKNLTSELEILALYKARDIDREVLFGLAALLPKEEVTKLVKEIYARHKHTKRATTEPVSP